MSRLNRLLLSGIGVMLVLTLAVNLQADQAPGGANKPAQGGKFDPKEQAAKEQELVRKYKEFEDMLLVLKQRLDRSDRREDKDQAALLARVLDTSSGFSIQTRFAEMVRFLSTQDLKRAADINDLTLKSKRLADDLKVILDLLRGANSAEAKKQERMELEKLVKELERIIRDQKNVIGKIEANADKNNTAQDQREVRNDTRDIGKKLNPDDKKGGDGKGGEATKPGESKEGKGEGAKGESKNQGKGGEGQAGEKPGDSKNQGKPGEGKPGEAKAGKGGEGKAGDPKSGDPKGGAKAGESGKGGEGKGDAKGGEGAGKGGEGGKGGGKGGDSKGGAKGGEQGDKKGGDEGKAKGDESKVRSKDDPQQEGAAKKGGDQKGGEQGGAKGEQKGGQQGSASKQGGQQQKQEGGQQGGSKSSSQSGQGGAKGSGQPKEGGGDPKGGDQGGAKGGGDQGGKEQDTPQSKAQKRIKEAEDHMRKVEKEIEQAKRPEAIKEGEKAVEKLEDAKRKLEELLRQLREEELERILTDLKLRCEKMLAMQIAVYNATKALDRNILSNPDKKPTRANVQDSVNLSDDEKKIVAEATKAIEVIEAEGTAVAFGEVFQQVREDMKHVERRLGITDTGRVTQSIEQDIIDTLQEMIKALEKAKQDMQNKPSPPKPGQPPPNQDQKLLDQIAELKMIRAMQMRVNKRTELYGNQYEGEQAQVPEIRGELRNLSERQERIVRVTQDIASGKNK